MVLFFVFQSQADAGGDVQVSVLGRGVAVLWVWIDLSGGIPVIRKFSVVLGKLRKIRTLGVSGVGVCVCVCVCVSVEGCQLSFTGRNGFILRSCPVYTFPYEIIVIDGIKKFFTYLAK